MTGGGRSRFGMPFWEAYKLLAGGQVKKTLFS
jgi:hypothetical protein